MTPDTLKVDRTFKGVGRVRKATGTTNPVLRRKMSRMLTTIHGEEGGLVILRAWRDGRFSLLELYDAYQRGAHHELPSGPVSADLAAEMRAWVTDADCSAKHAESIETSVRYLERARKRATADDLPELVMLLRTSLGTAHPTSYNRLRSHALAFLRDTRTKLSPLYVRVHAIGRRKVKTTVQRRPLTPDEMRGWFPHPETSEVDAIAWTIATTGMHQKELWGKWAALRDRIHVAGTKRTGKTGQAGRVRDVPLVLAPFHPRMHRRTWEDKLRERTRDFTPYDLRRTYMNWMRSAGIPGIRRKLYMGHESLTVSELYELHEVDAHLLDDGRAMRTYLTLPEPGPAGLSLVKNA